MHAMGPRAIRAVVANPRAQGGRAARLLPALRDALPPGVALHTPGDIPEALALLRGLPPGSRVVAVGGDGTLHRWLPALLERGHELGVVPLGSGNDTARALGLRRGSPLPWLTHALNGPPSTMDIGLASWHDGQGERHDTPFLSSLSAGFDAAVVARALTGPPRLRGLPRYLWATLRELAALRSWHLDVTVDGQHRHEGPALFAATLNTATFGGGMPATPAARTRDGLLNLLLAGPFSRPGALGMLPRLLVGWHLGHPRIHTRAFEQMTVLGRGDLPLAADGEWLGLARSFTVAVRPGALRVVRAPNSG
ncbi:MAG: diacylglycerol kinase family lipid kinase [Hydrogenophaga sp.]|uniref:Diacylglycerol kinase family lipid kinase n=1 Tax=Hydrogenophaga crocea TaxID=2716225 RepID=A0A6G8IIL3_9BURK|nr:MULTISPECIES: diacylglycerol kinase family protein [Hydrogenophaga]MBL0944986.1 diacylglycerol kinase family lipid kinase [Hydrogenophaga sp.]QIM53044.1 diacylglycerol kinase family lipid kinase [Hydrogenophaga crocea]